MKRSNVATNRLEPSDRVSGRLLLASRYADCLRRLASRSARAGCRDLARMLMEISGCLDRMGYDLAFSDHSSDILGRANRIIGTVERLVANREREGLFN